MATTTFDFTGSVVLVTGGGTGIGLAITRAFLDAGATVAITGRRRERLESALEGVPAERGAALPADVSDPAQVRRLVAGVVDRFGRLDVVVSNAAGYESGEVTDLAGERFDAVVAVDVRAFWTPPAPEWDVVARVLEPGGRVVLGFSVMRPDDRDRVRAAVAGPAGERGFAVTATAEAATVPFPTAAIEVRRPG
ncbi:SDR family NAD(P)-dependent oxidoreductase [Geodermatophilus sp. SYSU D01036]